MLFWRVYPLQIARLLIGAFSNQNQLFAEGDAA